MEATTMATMLKTGSNGNDVRALQERLKRLGYNLDTDGAFGPSTESAVRHLQKSFGYNVDGVVGDATQKLIEQQLALNWNATRPAGADAGKNQHPMPGKS
jgi:peptidoglycan hydrolase-like protein with peptidoglycan-binding domain